MIDAALFVVYAVASIVSMLLIKTWLPALRIAYAHDIGIAGPGLFVLAGAGLYAASFLIWMVILARQPLSIAFPSAVGLTLLGSTLAASAVLGEAVTPTRLVGIALILAGLFFVVRS
jgi:multidrug transporter EmrE-like cation transporter